jgi:hypothetical protein
MALPPDAASGGPLRRAVDAAEFAAQALLGSDGHQFELRDDDPRQRRDGRLARGQPLFVVEVLRPLHIRNSRYSGWDSVTFTRITSSTETPAASRNLTIMWKSSLICSAGSVEISPDSGLRPTSEADTTILPIRDPAGRPGPCPTPGR